MTSNAPDDGARTVLRPFGATPFTGTQETAWSAGLADAIAAASAAAAERTQAVWLPRVGSGTWVQACGRDRERFEAAAGLPVGSETALETVLP